MKIEFLVKPYLAPTLFIELCAVPFLQNLKRWNIVIKEIDNKEPDRDDSFEDCQIIDIALNFHVHHLIRLSIGFQFLHSELLLRSQPFSK